MGQVAVKAIVILALGWWVTSRVASAVLAWERIAQSDADDDAPIADEHDESPHWPDVDESEHFIG